MWCEMGSCISWHADPAALGEADTRARAIAAGWRIDALGRLACPRCQQTDPGFWASRPLAVRDRDMALARTAPIPAVPGDGTARSAALPSSCDPGRAVHGYPPASQAELEWHHDFPADEAHPRWQISGKPSRYLHSLAVALNPARARRAYGGRQAAPRPDMIPRTCSGPTGRTSLGPTKIVCEDIPGPPATVIGTEKEGSAREVASGSGPSEVGPGEAGTDVVGPVRLRRVEPRRHGENTQTSSTARI